jgi:hypothetical protein
MLMEAAVTSSLLATNAVLATHGLRPYPVRTVPVRGLLPRRPGKRRAVAALPAHTAQQDTR